MTGVGEAFGTGGPVVDAAWLHERLGTPEVRLVDVRPASVYALGHLPGAFHADLYRPPLKFRDSSQAEQARFQAAVQAELRRLGVRGGERVIFYEDVAGATAAYGVWLLDYLGHGGGALLDGGLRAWLAAGLPVTRAVPPPDQSDLTGAPIARLLATAEEIETAGTAAAIAPSALTLLDTRSDREAAFGTIPGAIHLDWVRSLTPAGSLRPPEDLRRLFATAGIAPESAGRVVTYCGSGYRAAHSYVVLRALDFPDVANYAPSWNEWSRRR